MSSRVCFAASVAVLLVTACSDAEEPLRPEPAGSTGPGGVGGDGAGATSSGAAVGSGGDGGGVAAAGGASSGGAGGRGGTGSGGGDGGGGAAGTGWIRTFPGAEVGVGKLAVDAAGNVATIVLGVDADFGDGPQGKIFHLVKLDPAGDVVWARHYHSKVEGVSFDATGNLVIAGFMYGGEDLGAGPVGQVGENYLFVAKLDAQGDVVWTKAFPRDHAIPWAGPVVDSAGAIYFAGTVDGFLDLGATVLLPVDYDAFLVKLDAAGNHVWSTLLGPDADIRGIALDANDNLLVAGGYTGELAAWGLADAGVDGNGFLVKLDPDENLAWSLGIDSVGGGATGASVAVDAGGGVSLGGYFSGHIELGAGLTAASTDVFVARFDASGAHVWSTSWGDTSNLQVWATPPGETLVVGGLEGSATVGGQSLSSDEQDVLLASFQPDGTPIDATLYGAGYQWGESLVVDPSGHRIIRGRNFGTLDFGSGPVISMPGGDGLYFAKLAD